MDTIVLDKTGTLTHGDPQVVGVHPADGTSARQLLEAAAIAELPSEHPLSKAVLSRAKADGIKPPDPDHFAYTAGKGIVLAGPGFLKPLLAAFIHVSSELLFILNSTRLLPGRGR